MNLKISPQTAVRYKNIKYYGKYIFTRKVFPAKGDSLIPTKMLHFVTNFLPFLATERGYIWSHCQRHSTLEQLGNGEN
jgi:hypothetical protein